MVYPEPDLALMSSLGVVRPRLITCISFSDGYPMWQAISLGRITYIDERTLTMTGKCIDCGKVTDDQWYQSPLCRVCRVSQQLSEVAMQALREIWLEGEFRVVLEGDEYDPERARAAGHLHNFDLLDGAPWVGAVDTSEVIEVIYVASDRGQQIIDRFCTQWEAELDPNTPPGSLKPVAANIQVGLAATWQVEAAAEIEALASEEGITQLSKGLPKQFRNNPRYRDWMDRLIEMSATGG